MPLWVATGSPGIGVTPCARTVLAPAASAIAGAASRYAAASRRGAADARCVVKDDVVIGQPPLGASCSVAFDSTELDSGKSPRHALAPHLRLDSGLAQDPAPLLHVGADAVGEFVGCAAQELDAEHVRAPAHGRIFDGLIERMVDLTNDGR